MLTSVESMIGVFDLVKELRLIGEDRNGQARVLMEIARTLKPYIPSISEKVSLA